VERDGRLYSLDDIWLSGNLTVFLDERDEEIRRKLATRDVENVPLLDRISGSEQEDSVRIAGRLDSFLDSTLCQNQRKDFFSPSIHTEQNAKVGLHLQGGNLDRKEDSTLHQNIHSF
jgi:hypothetical protein